MKEIGEKLKQARESIGVSIAEVSEDLKAKPSEIEALENGEMEQFKDIYSLKYLIKDYSKYLGLSHQDMINEYNEYLFDYTSKISLDDIKKAQKEHYDKEDIKKVSSPYTVIHDKKSSVFRIALIVVIILLLVCLGLYIYSNDSNEVRGEIVEKV